MIIIMARKNYSAEFRQQAVDLYESSPDATLKQVATDLGVSRGTLADSGSRQSCGVWGVTRCDGAWGLQILG